METMELFQRLGLALAIGLLLGTERGWREREAGEGSRTAGIRTFALTGLLGGILGLIALPDNFVLFAAGFVAYAAILAAFKWRENAAEGDFGTTTIVAGMVAFALGGYAMIGEMRVAAGAAVAATAVLAVKAVAHGWLRQLTWQELRSGLVLLAMTFIALPLLPNRPVDPWLILNPYEIWLMTILIASVSFAGYAAIRTMGDQTGILVAGIAGGLVASTAVTLNFARLAAKNPANSRLLVGGILFANAVMMIRVLVVASIIQPMLIGALAVPLCAAALTTGGLGWGFMRASKTEDTRDQKLPLKNPFEITVVLTFGGLLAAMILVSHWVGASLGDPGIFGLAAVSGLADVDAITLSMARLAGGNVTTTTAALAILIVVASNTTAKVVLGVTVGGRAVGLGLLSAAIAAIAAGSAGYFGYVRLVLQAPV